MTNIFKRMTVVLAVSFFCAFSLSAQINVSGTVTDGTGNSVPGANVLIKGTLTGVVTDANGKFTIEAPDKDAVLVFSFIGYTTQEVIVGEKTTISIILAEDTQELDEVIVVGYGTMRKSDLTGAVARVNMEEKESLPNVTIAQALSGAMPGISIQPTGLAGQDPVMNIRGQNSLTGTQEPLVVLDGAIYYGSVADINVADVESIDVLKDASAAAVYGSRSANGVVLITTKKGKEGRPRVNFNAFYGAQWMTNNPMKVMNAEQYAVRLTDFVYQQGLYEWYKTAPTGSAGRPVRPDVTDRQVVAANPYLRGEEPQNYLDGKEVDWTKKVLRQGFEAPIQSYNLNFSGRNERFNYFASASYTNEQGVLRGDNFKRYTVRTNMDGKITDWLSVGLNVAYANSDFSGREANMEFARVASPLANDDTDLPPSQRSMYLIGENYMRHPLEKEAVYDRNTRDNLFFVASGKFNVPWVEGLSYEAKYSHMYFSRQDDRFYPATVHEGAGQSGLGERRPSWRRGWVFDNIVSYLRTFGDHSLNATLLYSREKSTYTAYTMSSQRFENPVLIYENMMMGSLISTADPDAWMETAVAYMGRLNYTYKSRYMLTATVRRDGSSTFSPNNKWAVFPSLSLGWVLSDESFMSNVQPWLYSKIRLSYGLNGNPGAGRYSSLSRVESSYYPWGDETTLTINPVADGMGNENLRWEKTASFNLGIDFGLWQRINGVIELYNANTSDVIVRRSLPRSSGFTGVRTNLGGIRNRGIEVSVNTINLQNTAIKWRTGLAFSLNRDKITELYGDTKEDRGNEWFVGSPITSIYDYEKNGIWQEEDLYEGRIGPNGTVLKGWYPGQYRLSDLPVKNADGSITPPDGVIDADHDRKIIGYRTPNYRFSITNTFNYKNWGLFVMINSVQGGNGYYLMNNYRNVNVQDRADDIRRINQSAVRPYWTPENRVNNATGVYNVPATNIGGIYEDRSFVRLQDVSLTYNFSRDQLGKMGGFIDQLQLYVSGRNLYTWTKWSGWDPEIFYFRQTGGNRDNQNEHNIAMRNVTAGVKLTF